MGFAHTLFKLDILYQHKHSVIEGHLPLTVLVVC